MKCVIFRCSKKQEMYLYVPWQAEESALLQDLPPELLQLTGRLEKVMELELSPERKLARASVTQVMASLTDKGFYIQSPPNDILRRDAGVLHNPSDSF